MTGKRFLEICDDLGLKLDISLDTGLISITYDTVDDASKIKKLENLKNKVCDAAQRKLDDDEELYAEVTAILRESERPGGI